jgi:hypothetical protein
MNKIVAKSSRTFKKKIAVPLYRYCARLYSVLMYPTILVI